MIPLRSTAFSYPAAPEKILRVPNDFVAEIMRRFPLLSKTNQQQESFFLNHFEVSLQNFWLRSCRREKKREGGYNVVQTCFVHFGLIAISVCRCPGAKNRTKRFQFGTRYFTLQKWAHGFNLTIPCGLPQGETLRTQIILQWYPEACRRVIHRQSHFYSDWFRRHGLENGQGVLSIRTLIALTRTHRVVVTG